MARPSPYCQRLDALERGNDLNQFTGQNYDAWRFRLFMTVRGEGLIEMLD